MSGWAQCLDDVQSIIHAGLDNCESLRAEGRSDDWALGWRMALEGLLQTLPRPPSIEEPASLELRLADCLADAIDTPVLKVRDILGGADIELRLGAFLPTISRRAAELLYETELLEEAGR